MNELHFATRLGKAVSFVLPQEPNFIDFTKYIFPEDYFWILQKNKKNTAESADVLLLGFKS